MNIVDDKYFDLIWWIMFFGASLNFGFAFTSNKKLVTVRLIGLGIMAFTALWFTYRFVNLFIGG